ncbi:MAG: hypothetical protein GC192_07015 [Bacteroidetes bacterium]|nr:hypothetical protein [Bacteroidota bacterium]
MDIDIEKIKADALLAIGKFKSIETFSEEEGHDTYVAAEILVMLIDDKPVSEEQLEFLKKQSIDFTKVLALIGVQAVPGSSLALVFLEKIAEKHGFSLIPKPLDAPDLKT